MRGDAEAEVMHIFRNQSDFETVHSQLMRMLVDVAALVDVGEWQSMPVDHPLLSTRELLDVTIQTPISNKSIMWQNQIKPNLPWAEDHFLERVSGKPLNPPPSAEWWPWAQKNNEEFKEGGQFSHTYPERMWPRAAGTPDEDCVTFPDGNCVASHCRLHGDGLFGIRWRYGDLDDLLMKLSKSPMTRQAYLPIWFPEDLGAPEGARLPCTLGYHFINRYNRLNVTYYIRSCDFVRHFRDDVYMAGRLGQWVVEGLQHLNPMLRDLRTGNLTMHIVSLHCFVGDIPKLEQEIKNEAQPR